MPYPSKSSFLRAAYVACYSLIWWSAVTPMSRAATEPLTPTQFLNIMQESYPPLNIAREKVKQNQAKLLEKQGAFDTVIKTKAEWKALGYYQNIVLDAEIRQPTTLWGTELFAGYRLGNGKFADYYGNKETLSLGEWRIGAETPLLQNGIVNPRLADLELLSLEIDRSELDIVEKQLKFAKTALKTYWNWRVLHQKEVVAEELLRRARLKVSQLQTEVNVGKTAPIYVTENQRSIYKRQQKLLDIQQDKQSTQIELNLYLAPSHAAKSQPLIPPPLPPAPICEDLPNTGAIVQRSLEEAQKSRPEVLQLQLQQRQNDVARQLAENFQWPALDLYFELSQDFGEGSETKEKTELLGGVKFYYPPALRKAQGQLLRIDSIERALNTELNFLNREIAQEVNTLLLQRNISCEQVRLAQLEIEVALKVAQAERDRFQLGSSTLFTVNLLEEAVAEARLRYLDALKAYFVAESLYPITLGLLPQS
jgi:outer membrane protein, heavy metal efflux system